MVEKIPPRVLSFFCELLNFHKNELFSNTVSNYFSAKFAFDYFSFLYDCSINPSSLLFPAAAEKCLNSIAFCLIDYGMTEFEYHTTKEWRTIRGFRTCAEVMEHLKLITHDGFHEAEEALLQRNGLNFAKLAILKTLMENGRIQTLELENIERPIINEDLHPFLESLHKAGYITPIPTSQLPCVQVKELKDVRDELYRKIKADNEIFWLEDLKSRQKEPFEREFVNEAEHESLTDLISKDEGLTLEFKSSMLWDNREKKVKKELKIVVAKELAAFMNTKGGILLIGVENDKKVSGIEKDLAVLKKSKDEFELTFTNLVNIYLGRVYRTYTDLNFSKLNDKEIAIIRVKTSPSPVYLRCEGQKEEFYIRVGNACQRLELSEAIRYIKEHWL